MGGLLRGGGGEQEQVAVRPGGDRQAAGAQGAAVFAVAVGGERSEPVAVECGSDDDQVLLVGEAPGAGGGDRGAGPGDVRAGDVVAEGDGDHRARSQGPEGLVQRGPEPPVACPGLVVRAVVGVGDFEQDQSGPPGLDGGRGRRGVGVAGGERAQQARGGILVAEGAGQGGSGGGGVLVGQAGAGPVGQPARGLAGGGRSGRREPEGGRDVDAARRARPAAGG
jgi:hypothetical protein